MKNNSYSALHVICGSITDVEFEDTSFIINVKDKYVYEHLTESTNFNLLKRAFIWQDLSLDIKINLLSKAGLPSDKDIEKLKQLVGDFLQVEEEKENNN